MLRIGVTAQSFIVYQQRQLWRLCEKIQGTMGVYYYTAWNMMNKIRNVMEA